MSEIYRPRQHGYWYHFFYLIVIMGSLLVLGSSSVFYALGYQINWEAHSIQQTGIISINSNEFHDGITIYVNNSAFGTNLPFNTRYVFPGVYQVDVKKEGYQRWSRQVNVKPNKVNNFHYIVLVPTDLQSKTIPAPDVQLPITPPAGGDGVEIRSNNELWVDGLFVTRTSDPIVAAQSYPDGQHVVYQTGKTLLLTDRDGFSTQYLITLANELPLRFSFIDGGRTLVYLTDAGTTVKTSLY